MCQWTSEAQYFLFSQKGGGSHPLQASPSSVITCTFSCLQGPTGTEIWGHTVLHGRETCPHTRDFHQGEGHGDNYELTIVVFHPNNLCFHPKPYRTQGVERRAKIHLATLTKLTKSWVWVSLALKWRWWCLWGHFSQNRDAISYSLALKLLHRLACSPTLEQFLDCQLPTDSWDPCLWERKTAHFFIQSVSTPPPQPRCAEPQLCSENWGLLVPRLAREQSGETSPAQATRAELGSGTQHHGRSHKAGFTPWSNDLWDSFFSISALHELVPGAEAQAEVLPS